MAYLYCPDCGWAIGEFYSILDLEGEKGDRLIASYKANHICQPPPELPENQAWMDVHQGGA